MCVINSALVSTKRSVSLTGEPARYIWYPGTQVQAPNTQVFKRSVSLHGEPARYIWYLVPGTQVPRYKHQVPRYLRGVRLYLESLPEARDGGGESSLMRDEYLLEKLGLSFEHKNKMVVIICVQ